MTQLVVKRTGDPVTDLHNLSEGFSTALQTNRLGDAEKALAIQTEIVSSAETRFPERDDWMTLIEARRHYLSYRLHRHDPGIEKITSLTAIVSRAVPVACAGMACAIPPIGDGCVTQHSNLSAIQKKICLIRLDALVEKLTVLGGEHARQGRLVDAERTRNTAARVHRSICRLETTQSRLSSQSYLDYWAEVSSSHVALSLGHFSKARTHLRLAFAAARRLNIERSFPNYFQNPSEVRSHIYLVNAMQRVSQERFLKARYSYTRWRKLNASVATRFRQDSVEILITVCDILDELQRGANPVLLWSMLDDFRSRAYIGEALECLLGHMSQLRVAMVADQQDHLDRTKRLSQTRSAEFGSRWRLFGYDLPIRPEDKLAKQAPPQYHRPSFLHYAHLPQVHHDDDIASLERDLRHFMLVVADYLASTRRGQSRVTVGLSTRVPLLELALLLDRNANVELFTDRTKRFLQYQMQRDYRGALRTLEALLHATKHLTPHCIQATSYERQAFDDTSSDTSTVTVRRLCVDVPALMTIVGAEGVIPDRYYYLHPVWNTRLAKRYKVRNERLIESEILKYLDTIQNGWAGKLSYAPRFRAWASQFREDEILLAVKLFSALRVFDAAMIRLSCLEIYRRLCEVVEPGTELCIFGLGHTAKSGRLTPYSFRQAISQLEGKTPLDCRSSSVYREISAVSDAPPKVAVFLDDFVGTGKQSRRIIASYIAKHEWLRSARRYLSWITGFSSAAADISASSEDLVSGVILGMPLDGSERAFSLESTLWQTPEELSAANAWASELGSELLLTSDHGLDAHEDCLGFGGSQALVVFPHNIPNNTLPIFWARGTRAGKSWIPLYDRFD